MNVKTYREANTDLDHHLAFVRSLVSLYNSNFMLEVSKVLCLLQGLHKEDVTHVPGPVVPRVV